MENVCYKTNQDLCRISGHASQAKAGLSGTWAGVPDKSSRGLGGMSRYSAQILICITMSSAELLWKKKEKKDISFFNTDMAPVAAILPYGRPGRGRFNNTYELLNLRALKFSPVDEIRIFQCMGMIFCVEFQRYPLKFHTKYLTHTLKDVTYKQHWNFKSS